MNYRTKGSFLNIVGIVLAVLMAVAFAMFLAGSYKRSPGTVPNVGVRVLVSAGTMMHEEPDATSRVWLTKEHQIWEVSAKNEVRNVSDPNTPIGRIIPNAPDFVFLVQRDDTGKVIAEAWARCTELKQ